MIRVDQRQPDELRKLEIIPNVLNNADGSCEVRWGKNRLLCSAMLEAQVPKWLAGQGKGWLTAEYAMMPYASPQRMQRERERGKPNSRGVEIQRIIGRSLRSIFDLEAFGERCLTVDVDVLEADGGTRTAGITGGFVAIALAVDKLLKEGQLSQSKSYISDYLAAVSVGIVEGQPVLDLCYLEDSQAQTDLNVAMTGKGEFVELQGTAEENPFSRDELNTMLSYAEKGVREIIEVQKSVINPDIIGKK